MNSPMVSVVITVYNLEKYLDKTIESVISQKTDFIYEVLIGDDGSTDNSINIIAQWQQKHPDIVSCYVMPREKDKKYDPIKRASENRLEGQKRARGKYITYLDGDDYYISFDRLSKLVRILEDPENKDCSIAATNMNYEDKINDKSFLTPIISKKIMTQKMSPSTYWRRYWIHAEACLFRNMKIDIGNNQLFYFDDNLITFYYLKYGSIYYISDLTVNYRRHDTAYYKLDELERQLINYFDYEAEVKYNRLLFKSSMRRHSENYFYCFVHKRDINENLKNKYIDIVENYPYLVALLNFYNTGFKKKYLLYRRYFIWKLFCKKDRAFEKLKRLYLKE